MSLPEPVVIGVTSVPRLAGHVRLRHDPVRDRWVMLAPERMFVLDHAAAAIVQRVDGVRDVAAITGDLCENFDAPPAVIQGDVINLLQDLADKVLIVA